MFTTNDIKLIDEFLKPINNSNKIVWRIKYKGEYIKTYSGKTAWSGKGPAKNALNGYLDRYVSLDKQHMMSKYFEEAFTRKTYSNHLKIESVKLASALINEGLIEIVKIQ